MISPEQIPDELRQLWHHAKTGKLSQSTANASVVVLIEKIVDLLPKKRSTFTPLSPLQSKDS